MSSDAATARTAAACPFNVIVTFPAPRAVADIARVLRVVQFQAHRPGAFKKPSTFQLDRCRF